MTVRMGYLPSERNSGALALAHLCGRVEDVSRKFVVTKTKVRVVATDSDHICLDRRC